MKVQTAAGSVIDLGTTETAPTIGITDYSRRNTDAFGVTTVVERAYSRRMSVRVALPPDSVDAVRAKLEELRATSALWIADERFAWLTTQGYYKDFELDLQTSSLSFCRLTVEGLAGFENVTDNGSDPAMLGQKSTLRLLQPFTKPALLVTSSLPEADHPEWAAGTTYVAGQRVIKAATHRIYESVAAGNVGKDPAGATGEWIDVGPTNRWAMFDQALGTATIASNSITLTLAPEVANAVALLDVIADSVRVRSSAFDRTQAVSGGSVTFLDLPETTGQVTVTITGSGQVSVGTLLIGKVVGLGETEASPTARITDYSKKDVDAFGVPTIIERAFAKGMSMRALFRTNALDVVANRLAAVRARPCLWVGQNGVDTLTVYGFCKDWSIEAGETTSRLSLSIEGLSKAPVAIQGVSKQQLIDQALDAADQAAAALAAINVISSDAYLSASEKPQTIREWEAIDGERPSFTAQAYALLVPQVEYQAAYLDLRNYLSSLYPLWYDTATDTPIDPATFNSRFSAYYVKRSELLMAMADKSANNSAIGGANRVPYSRFKDPRRGWGVTYNPNGLQILEQRFDLDGLSLFKALGSFTGPGQTFVMGGDVRKGGVTPVRPHERIYAGSKLEVQAARSEYTWALALWWLNAAGQKLSRQTIAQGSWHLPLTASPLFKFLDVPDGAFGAFFEVEAGSGSGAEGGLNIALIEPMIDSAGALQTEPPRWTPGPEYELGADRTMVTAGPANAGVPYDYTGTAIQQWVDLQYYLAVAGGAVTSGTITATYRVIDGGVNGLTPSSGSRPLAVANGVAPLTIGSLESDVASVEVTLAHDGIARPPTTTTFTKQKAAPPTPTSPPPSGGTTGGSTSTASSQTSGFAAINSTSFAAVSSVLAFVATGSSLNLIADLNFRPTKTGGAGSWTVEGYFQRNVGTSANPVWSNVGQAGTANSEVVTETAVGEPSFTYANPANLQMTRTDTDLTPGTTYEYRFVARLLSGNRSHVPTGSVSISS